MPAVCAVCGMVNPDGSRFCNSCGSRLPERAALAEERKVITALFCDLVGFTATSESADPEDVDRMLSRYFAAARGQIEAHGGVVEKFIGDAVVGVFGVPEAHEDDPERAIRAPALAEIAELRSERES
jgi:class 3 adenylate cyclase